MDPTPLKYRAFLSYRHSDTGWAKRLHKALESFRIDRDLVGRETQCGPVPKRLRPIFRDREDFSAGHSLTEQTLGALRASQFLIVLCSPAAKESHYVNEEIRLFKELGGAERIVPVIIDGEPGHPELECFPDALRFEVDERGEITDRPVELIAADVREQGDGAQLAVAKVVARLIGLDTDEVYRRAERDRRRKSRIRNGIIASLVAMLLAASGSAVWAYQQLKTNEEFLIATLARATSIVDTAIGQSNRFGIPRKVTLQLLEQADGLFDDMSRLGRITPDLKRQKARMLLQLARNYESLGETDKQLERIEQSVVIVRELAEEEPELAKNRHNLATVLSHRGDMLFSRGQTEAALSDYSESIAIRQKLHQEDPSDIIRLRALAGSYLEVGLATSSRDRGKALELYREAIDLLESPKENADREQHDHVLLVSVAHERIAQSLMARGGSSEALEHYQKSLAMTERLLETAPADALLLKNIVGLHGAIGNIHLTQGRAAEAQASHQKEVSAAERLTTSDPDRADWQYALGLAYGRLGSSAFAGGDLAKALDMAQKSRGIMDGLVKRDPSNSAVWYWLAATHDSIAQIHNARQEYKEAAAAYGQAQDILVNLVAADRANLDWRDYLATLYGRSGWVLSELDDQAASYADFSRAQEMLAEIAKLDPENTLWKTKLAESYHVVGAHQGDLGDSDAALKSLSASVQIWEQMVAEQPENIFWQFHLSAALESLGTVHVAVSDPESAGAAYRRSREIIDRYSGGAAQDAVWRLRVAINDTGQGRVLVLLNRHDEALELFKSSRSMLQGMPEQAKTPEVVAILAELEQQIKSLEN